MLADSRQLLDFTRDSCRGWDSRLAPAPGHGVIAADESAIRFRGNRIGTRYRIEFDAALDVELEVIERGGRANRFVASMFNRFGDPLVLVALDRACELQVARRVNYNIKGQAIDVVTLDADLEPRGAADWLNPPLEFAARGAAAEPAGDAAPVRVALVDSGVNYLLPEINRRLARAADGGLVGYDFWEMDAQPFDAHPVNSGFFVQRHGTRTASLLLREAPGVELVPYRYPRPDMSRMQALVEHADEHGVGIVGLPLGSNRLDDWNEFARAAREHPHMLFIASAGNDGRDIDERPVYPAALDLDNLLVVTSADDFVAPAARTNWGRVSVDYLLPAERLDALDYDGRDTRVSGSSYAVARLAALAARLQSEHRAWRAAELAAELRRRYGGRDPAALDWVGIGYIADPLAGAPLVKRLQAPFDIDPPRQETAHLLPLEVLVLDDRWTRARVENTLRRAFEVLSQCALGAGQVAIYSIRADDYLRDLSTGGARTLLEAAGGAQTTVVFARDTRMQAQFTGEAFGLGNTRTRPWLANSVWLMPDVDDPGIALAHELYHVLANSGVHVEGQANLMQGRTRPESTELTPQQCARLQAEGHKNGLLN